MVWDYDLLRVPRTIPTSHNYPQRSLSNFPVLAHHFVFIFLLLHQQVCVWWTPCFWWQSTGAGPVGSFNEKRVVPLQHIAKIWMGNYLIKTLWKCCHLLTTDLLTICQSFCCKLLTYSKLNMELHFGTCRTLVEGLHGKWCLIICSQIYEGWMRGSKMCVKEDALVFEGLLVLSGDGQYFSIIHLWI